MVLEVRIVNYRDLTGRASERGFHRRTLAPVFFVAEKDPLDLGARIPRLFPLESFENLRRVIRGAVIDHDHLHSLQVRGGIQDL